jgi:DUF177 domain-containing protein
VLITRQELELHPVTVSKIYPRGALDYQEAVFSQVGPLEVKAVARLAGQEIRIDGHISARLEAACDRCLAKVGIPIESDFDLLYRPLSSIAREEEIEVPEDELAVGFYSGEGIELAEVVTEQVILSFPMKVVCKLDCRGLCPTCGANRNFERCTCFSQRKDSPFAFLKEG